MIAIKHSGNKSRRLQILFVFLTFSISWACWFNAHQVGNKGLYVQVFGAWRGVSGQTAVVLFGNFAPGLVAIFLCLVYQGKKEVLDLFKSLNPFHTSPKLLLIAILVPTLALLVAAGLNLFSGGSSIQLPKISFWFWSVLINLPFVPLWEELGWRGFLLPRLQSAHSSFVASILVGLVWGFWHAPLQAQAYRTLPHVNAFFGFVIFCFSVVGLSVILAWMYNKANARLFSCIVFHSVLNNTSPYLIDYAVRKDGLRPLVWSAVAIWGVAFYLRIRDGKNLGAVMVQSSAPDFS